MSESTTPLGSSSKRSNSRSGRNPPSRPTTPLRPSSRSSIRSSHTASVNGNGEFPLDTFEPAFAELSDAMADLEANFMHLQIMHESLSRFSESFASFLYGLNMNAFCVDFPEAPILESFKRAKQQEESLARSTGSERHMGHDDGETTFMTTDTSFVDNPPTVSKPPPKYQTPRTPAPASRIAAPSNRGGTAGRGGSVRGGVRGTRGSGLARGRGSGVR